MDRDTKFCKSFRATIERRSISEVVRASERSYSLKEILVAIIKEYAFAQDRNERMEGIDVP